MKRNWVIGILSLFIIIGGIWGLLSYARYLAFYDMNRLWTGEYLNKSVSPKGTYTVKTYFVNGGSPAVRGELLIKGENEKPKNIYWNIHESTAKVSWVDDDTVIINGHTLNLSNEVYDFRR